MNRSSRPPSCAVPLALLWSHAGASYRLTPWPDVRLERNYDGEWMGVTASGEVLEAGSKSVSGQAWRGYAEFIPLATREFLAPFRRNRFAALVVAARCPELLGVLLDVPALTGFVAAHAMLRGAARERWDELNAVFERAGVYAVLEWLGLPASRPTLSILRNLIAPDLPAPLLAPLRTVLWKPEGVFALAALPVIGDRELTDVCALAA